MILARMAGERPADMSETRAWAVANDIINGTTAGTLNPAGTATRAQFAVVRYRFVS